MDGSVAGPPAIELEDAGRPLVLTKVTVGQAGTIEKARLDECLGSARRPPPGRPAVKRIAVDGESLTFSNPSGEIVVGCDNTLGRREGDARWCGSAYGQIRRGRLLDPRLDVLCRTESGSPIAFLWVEPRPAARWITVDQPGYTEVYAVAAGLPVRVSTSAGVDLESTSAEVDVAQYDSDGKLIERSTLTTRVAS